MTTYPQVLDPRERYLKQFQCARLRKTYDDFVAIPHYNATCFFFFNRLYSTEDFADRDKAFKSIYHLARRFLSGSVITSMRELIALEELTLQLDAELRDMLDRMGAPPEFDMQTYEQAYRACANFEQRERQIELLDITIRLVHRISHHFGIGFVLRALHQACLIFGDTRMVDFLMDGYRAFENLPDIEPLAGAMVHRESQRLYRIFGMPFHEPW